jgi:hypothetical protein
MTPQPPFTSSTPYSSGEYPGPSGIVACFSMEIAINPAMPTINGPYFNTVRMLKQYLWRPTFPDGDGWQPRRWNWLWRVSVVTLSTGVEIWTRHFGRCSITRKGVTRKRSLDSTRSQDISEVAAFGIVDALELSRLTRS